MPTADKPLATTKVLVTRPAHQAAAFCRMIESAGGEAIRFPVIDIVPATNQGAVSQQLQQLDEYDIAIFISANAVGHTISLCPQGLPSALKIAAVGNKTAACLRAQGIPVDIVPKQGFNTEALLESPLLHVVQGKRIAIIRGVGGRETLAETLTQRGAKVNYIEVYQRALPEQRLSNIMDYQNCDIIAVTSQQGLRNLIALTDDRDWLFNTALACNSQRTASLARELGFHQDIVTSQEPDDEAMKATIINWQQRCNKSRQQA